MEWSNAPYCAILVVLLLPPAGHAQQKEQQLPEWQRTEFKRIIEEAGLNCPVPKTLTFDSEDGRGQILRLRCESIPPRGSPALSWDLRVIMGPKALRFERW